jgi:chromosome partitioning protein
MLTVAIANQKGGVGKTATTLGIASAMRARGRRVLVVDLDPQGNATAGLGIRTDENTLTSGDVIAGNQKGVAAQAILATAWGDSVGCIPSELGVAERDKDTGLGFEFRLRKALEGIDDYDLILLDCPPSVGHLVSNALVAADYALLVTTAASDSLRAIRNVMQSIEVVKEHYNSSLMVAGVVVNYVDLRQSEQRYRLDELNATYGPLVWEPYIADRTTVSEAKGAAAPIHEYGYRSKEVSGTYDTIADRLVGLGE